MTVSRGGARPWWVIWPSLAGFAVVVFMVLGVVLEGETPSYGDPDQEWVDWFADDGNRARAVIATFLFALAALALLLFVVHLAHWVRRGATGYDPASTIVLVAGSIFSALVLLGGVGIHQVSLGQTFDGDYDFQSAEVLRVSPTIGYGALLIGAFFAALMIAVVSAAAQQRGLMPKWLVIAGYIVAIALLFAAYFLPLILLVLWILAVSILWLKRPQTA